MQQTIGIDKINFYVPHYALSLETLAKTRHVEPSKFTVGLGLNQMSICAPDEDIVTLASQAAFPLISKNDVAAIDTLLFATESGIDQSKAAGIYVHRLLGLSPRCSVVELKQACYSATSAINMACALVTQNPQRKVLVIAADISRYGLNTPGESTQGAGAVAILISAQPRILALDARRGTFTEDVMDFWRPNYREEALVEGKFSTEMYLKALTESWQHYQQQTKFNFQDHAASCYHVPYPRLVEKAHAKLAQLNQAPITNLEPSLHYCRLIGNTYTASLYISLISLLANHKTSLENQRIGFYSYGSGCVGEYFSGVVQKDYLTHLTIASWETMLQQRETIDCAQYEKWYLERPNNDGTIYTTPSIQRHGFRFKGVTNHQRQYETV